VLFFRRRSGIVNVKMIITEEKILSNIDKVQKMINPSNKKQIIQLEEDAFFKDLIDSIKTYLTEYPKKKNFPLSVYKASYGLVEYATNQFEENTKRIEGLIRQRETNITFAGVLRELLSVCESKQKDWRLQVKQIVGKTSEDIIEALIIIGKTRNPETENYKDAVKLLQARAANLEANLHIEIDMERIEDRSKALSYIGIEVAEALKGIPTPVDNGADEQAEELETQYIEETRFEVKPSLWQRIKQSRLVRALAYITRIKIVLDVPALPEGDPKK